MPRKAAVKARGAFLAEKPKLGLPDPLETAQEAARLAQAGNLKLARCVDALRQALETIVAAEYDFQTGRPVAGEQLRTLAIEGLNAYSAITGQNWKLPKNKLTGASRAGDRSLNHLED